MSVIEAFGNIADELAGLAPEKVANLKASAAMSERLEELVQKKKQDQLSLEETVELERYLSLDLLINLAKARARVLLIS